MEHRILSLITFFVAVALSADAPQGEPPGFAQVLSGAIKLDSLSGGAGNIPCSSLGEPG